MNLYGLADIEFAEKDPNIIKTEIISGYESAFREATGERITLYPGDPRRLFLLSIAEIIILQRNIIDWTAKQNMLAYSTGSRLDHLGLLLGVTRLPAQRARVTIRFNLSAVRPNTALISMGTRVTPSDNEIYFTTSENLEIPAGELSGEVSALALESGGSSNGLLPGQINKLVDPLPYIQGISNVTASEGGADVEDDENLRERIRLAPESFSNAGSMGAYQFWARSASQLIVDVGVHSPEPGMVNIYPLLKNGEIPGQEILDLVTSICSADTARPMTDLVTVLSPYAVEFALDVTWYLERKNAAMASAISAAVGASADDWLLWQRSALGRDINPSELVRRMMEAGAKRIIVNSPDFYALEFNQLGTASEVNVYYGGVEDA